MSPDKNSKLADIAEWYYVDGLNQSEIARKIGVDRSMVSRLLAEARQQNIVEIRIRRPISANQELEDQLEARFNLLDAHVLINSGAEYTQLLKQLGIAGVNILKKFIKPGIVLGLSWGTAVSAVVDAFEQTRPISIKIVQLVGAMGSQNRVYDGHGLVQRLASAMGCEGYFLNAPFIVEDPEIASALLGNQNVAEAISLAQKCDVAVVGIGSTEPEYSSFYQAGYVPLADLKELRDFGMVGDVCGRHFNHQGESPDLDFHNRIITIAEEAFKQIPTRIGVAGGIGKAEAILGALRGNFINVLVTDDEAARCILDNA